MPFINARKRVEFFRVSEDEFRHMEEASNSSGARNISEFARFAVQNFAARDQRVGHDDISPIYQRLEEVATLMRQVHVSIERVTTQPIAQCACGAAPARSNPVKKEKSGN